MSFSLRKAEGALAALITLGAVWLRYVAATSGGALWRDEANTVGLATLPTLRDVWTNLQYDSFPILWLLIVRALSSLAGPMNDYAFRVFGFVIGVGLVGALWFYARSFRQSYPLLSLALFAMSPPVIVWGDSLRAHGFGIVLILLAAALLWRFVQRPNVARFSLATLASVASVHVLFYNSVLLLAVCAGAVAVCATHRSWKAAAMVLSIGALSAISLLPYVPAIRDAGRWNLLLQMPSYTLAWFFFKLYETVAVAGPWAFFIWLALFWLAFFVAARMARFRTQLNLSGTEMDATLFTAVSLSVGSVGFFLFLKTLAYPTQAWYYLPLLALVAVSIDTILGLRMRTPRARIVRLIAAFVIAGATFFPALTAARRRMTNVDLVAARVDAIAGPRDFVVVNKWYNGVSFDRYYRGTAKWMTAPPIGFHRFHRYDMVKDRMTSDQATVLRPLMEEMGTALREGHRVFVAGELLLPPLGKTPKILPPALLPGQPWPEELYYPEWSAMIGYFLQQHALSISTMPVESHAPISPMENLSLWVAEGWRP